MADLIEFGKAAKVVLAEMLSTPEQDRGDVFTASRYVLTHLDRLTVLNYGTKVFEWALTIQVEHALADRAAGMAVVEKPEVHPKLPRVS